MLDLPAFAQAGFGIARGKVRGPISWQGPRFPVTTYGPIRTQLRLSDGFDEQDLI